MADQMWYNLGSAQYLSELLYNTIMNKYILVYIYIYI